MGDYLGPSIHGTVFVILLWCAFDLTPKLVAEPLSEYPSLWSCGVLVRADDLVAKKKDCDA